LKLQYNRLNLLKDFPREERFSLSNQITRASLSIPSNIAEGSSRNSEKDYHRFLEHSLGSAFEVETQLLIADAVNFDDQSIRTKMMQDVLDEQKMLTSFMSKLNK
jgi:four helix bundle protein